METIRRIYILLVCTVTLLTLTVETTALLWDVNPLGPRAPVFTIAFEIAALVVALPLFLVHWLWAQRLAWAEEERGDILRRVYLYAMLGVFVFAFTSQVLNLVTALASLALNTPPPTGARVVPLGKTLVDPVIAMVVLALLGLYHYRTIQRDARIVPETGGAATVHRLYALAFSATGLGMAVFSFVQLLRWVLFQVGPRLVVRDITVADELARLLVGIVLWLVFWRAAQLRFNGPSDEERESALRKFYLYLVVTAAAVGFVLGATFILDELLRQAFGLKPGDDLRNPLSLACTMAVVWAFHYAVLRADTRRARTLPRQAGIRRLYLYLVAAIGLASFLGGLIAGGNALIRTLLGEAIGVGVKELFALALAAILAGLPVWLWPWFTLQKGALNEGPLGAEERRSLARKIYLYFYLFLATMTALGSIVFILSQILSIALGDRIPNDLVANLSQAIGFALIAVCVWVYHGWALRTDGSIARQERMERIGQTGIAVVDGQEGRWGCEILDALKREWPDLQVHPVGLTRVAAAAMGLTADQSAAQARVPALSSAAVIVGPWTIAWAADGGAPEIMSAIAASPARKFLIPFATGGWEWIGVEHGSDEALVRLAVRTVKQVLEGEEIKPARSPILVVIVVIIAALVALWLLAGLMSFIN
ncbi:MAG: DUF5671 domain-containing protein [Acidobacteriota bacterium]